MCSLSLARSSRTVWLCSFPGECRLRALNSVLTAFVGIGLGTDESCYVVVRGIILDRLRFT